MRNVYNIICYFDSIASKTMNGEKRTKKIVHIKHQLMEV
jgi:hypothetical protein